MRHITLVLVSDNYASTTVGPMEVFHSAGCLWQELHGGSAKRHFELTVASVDGQPVVSHQGIAIAPHCAIHDIQHTDVILVPASGLDLEAQLPRHSALYPWLREWHRRGVYIGSVCTGASFLAEAGVLDGRRATTHWAVVSRYAARYPQVNWRVDEMVTEDRRILTAGGVHAGIDMSLYLVEKFCGRDIAIQVARALVVDMPRTHQSGYAVLPLSRPHEDERIRRAEEYIAENFAKNLTIEELAARVNMSARTFVRRFNAATGRMPGNYLQSQRIAVARVLLECRSPSVQAISYEVGYEDLAFFRKVFKRETGMTPAEYRSKFAGSGALPPVADAPARLR